MNSINKFVIINQEIVDCRENGRFVIDFISTDSEIQKNDSVAFSQEETMKNVGLETQLKPGENITAEEEISTDEPSSSSVNNLSFSSTYSLKEMLKKAICMIPCLDCGIILTVEDLLQHRIQAHGAGIVNFNYSCYQCELRFKNRSDLNYHIYKSH